MAVNIKLKRSNVSGQIPSSSQLELGEIALNTRDGKAFMKKFDGSVIEIGAVSTSSISASYADTAGFAFTAGSSSYSNTATTSSYSLIATSASFAATASYAANVPLTASYANNANSSSYALTASYAANVPQTASYAISASYASTASSADDFLVRGTLTAQTIVAQYITSSTSFITGSTKFGTISSNTHEFTGSVSISGSLGINGVDYNSTSASFNTRILNNSSSIGLLSGSYLASSSSFDTRILSNSSSIGLLSGSYLADSASFDTRILNNSSSISSNVGSLNNFSASILNYTASNNDSIAALYAATASLYNATASIYAATASLSASVGSLSSSFLNTSSSLSTRDSDLEIFSSSLDATFATDAQLNYSSSVLSGSTSALSASFLIVSASNSTRISSLEQFSSSLNNTFATDADLNALSSSFIAFTSSINSYTASNNDTISALYAATSSLNSFSASINSYTSSNNASIAQLYNETSSILAATASLYAFSASINNYTASNNAVITQLYNETASLKAATASLYNATASLYNATQSLYAFSASINNFTASQAVLNGTFATTGSNVFKGNQTVTGSLRTSGSNELVGNTILSGTLQIQGQYPSSAGSQSVSIVGNVDMDGYLRLDPVSSLIDTAISGAYLYVTSSTGDLYFAQNIKGFANTTRLRWLEGNLYTGLLNGGIITAATGSTTYQVSSGSGIIVNLNASLNDNPYPTIQYLNWGNLSASIAPLTASYQQAFVAIDSTGNIYQQGTPFSNGQFDTEINIGLVLFQNGSTINGVKTQPSVAYGAQQSQNIFNRAFGPLKLSGYTLAPSGSSTRSLIVASGTAYSPGSNYTIDPNEPSYTTDSGTNVSKIFRYRQSGSTWVYDTNAGAGYTTIDPTQYSDNGVLTAVPGTGPGRQWSIQRVFYFPNSVAKAIVVYYGNATYTTQTDATANIPYEPFVEAPNTAANAIYLGAIVVRNNADFTVNASYNIQPGGLFRQVGGSGGGGSVVTQTLSGLSDVLISGPTSGQALVYDSTAAKWENKSFISASISGNAATATSAVTAATASYVVLAQTASYALNSELLDGLDSTSFVSTGSFGAQTSSFNAFSASINSYTASAIIDSGSVSTRLVNLEAFSSSLDNTFATDADLNTLSSSFII